MLGTLAPKIHFDLLRLVHIQVQIVVLAPRGHVTHVALVDGLIVLVDETHHNHVVCKIDEEAGAEFRCTVIGQQSEE